MQSQGFQEISRVPEQGLTAASYYGLPQHFTLHARRGKPVFPKVHQSAWLKFRNVILENRIERFCQERAFALFDQGAQWSLIYLRRWLGMV
jgi:hypothetical protein